LIFRSAGVMKYFSFVRKELNRMQPDIFWEPNNLLPVRLKGFQGKLAVTIHDVFPLTIPECFSWKYRLYFKRGVASTIRQADLLIFNSKETRRNTEIHFPEAVGKKIFLSYIIMDPPAEREYAEIDLPPSYLLYLGNLERRKGCDTLLRAFVKYRCEGGEKKLVLAGSLKDPEMQDLIEEVAGQVGNVTYLGYVNDAQKRTLFRDCDCFIFPSRAEGFGMPILEAMEEGCSILASNLSVFREIVGKSVCYFDARGSHAAQVDSLCAALHEGCDARSKQYADILARYRADILGPSILDELKALVE